MNILFYNELDSTKIPNFKKFQSYIEVNDFKSADVKKIGDNLYRARLNIADRLLFSIYKHAGKSYALVLEFIKNHDYANSRFLRQVSDIDEDKIPTISTFNENDAVPLVYLNETLGFAAGCTVGIASATHDHLLFINPDSIFPSL